MIDLTVKTLDSRNHAFSVADDITVQQFKTTIQETITIPVESQRLIYCGRVLQDDKKLADYDVNGKVIHLVKCAPPQPGRRPGGNSGNGASTGSNSNASGRRGTRRFDGSAMHLGSVVIPVEPSLLVGEVRDGSRPRSWLLMSTAERMVQRATEVLDRLENPNSAQPASSSAAQPTAQPAAQPTTEPTVVQPAAVQPAAVQPAAVQPATQPAAEPTTQPAAAAASASTAATPHNSSRDSSGDHSPVVGSQHPGSNASETRPTAPQNTDAEMVEPTSTPAPSVQADLEIPNSATSGSAVPGSAPSASTSSPSSSFPPPPPSASSVPRRQGPSTTAMAALLEKLRIVHNRFTPYLCRYHQMLCDDPPLPQNPRVTTDRQNIASAVPEIMHLLSHAYHSISDLTVDMETAPPRQMHVPTLSHLMQFNMTTTRNPLTFSHMNGTAPPSSTSLAAEAATHALQALQRLQGAAGTATGSVSTSSSSASASNNRPEVNLSTSTSESGPATGTSTPIPNMTRAASAPPSAGGSSNSAATATNTSGTSTPSSSDPSSGQGQAQQPRQTRQSRTEPIVTMGMFDIPTNVEFFMEVGPSSITIDSVEATVVSSGSFTPSTSADTNPVGINFPWGGPPPQEVIDSVMQAVGHIINNTRLGTAAAPAGGAATTAAPGTTRASASPSSTSTSATSNSSPAASSTSTTASPNANNGSGSTPPGQNSQARGYTATHPTTSTQTRSTARPHVHIAATQIPGMNNFDPFLPCTSHHLHSRQLRRQTRPNTASNPPASSTPVGNPPAANNNTNSSESSTTTTSQPGPGTSPANAGSAPRAQITVNAFPQNMGQASLLNFIQSVPVFTGQDILSSMLGTLASTVNGGTAPEVPPQGNNASEEQEGRSLLSDLRLTMVRSITMSDVVAATLNQWEALNHIRGDLHRFFLSRVLEGQPPTEENVERGVNRLLNEIRPHFDLILETRLRDDIDVVATLNRFHEAVIPDFVKLILDEENANNFGSNAYEMVGSYLTKLWTIIMHCATNQEEAMETVIEVYVNRLSENPPLAMWTAQTLLSQLRGFIHSGGSAGPTSSSASSSSSAPPRASFARLPIDISEFIVHRDSSASSTTTPGSGPNACPCREHAESSAPSAATTDAPSGNNATLSSQNVLSEAASTVSSLASTSMDSSQECSLTAPTTSTKEVEQIATPMETDPQSPPQASSEAAASSSSHTASSTLLTGSKLQTTSDKTSETASSAISEGIAMDTDLPTVIQPESWHRVLPPEWVPIITRDASRQRRPVSQAPLSDAYLSGMPPKRRKVVTASRPQGSLNQVISANMERAIQASGVSTAGMSIVQEAAGSDQVLQEAYREQLRATVRANLSNNPDFSPERFPNAARYFGKS